MASCPRFLIAYHAKAGRLRSMLPPSALGGDSHIAFEYSPPAMQPSAGIEAEWRDFLANTSVQASDVHVGTVFLDPAPFERRLRALGACTFERFKDDVERTVAWLLPEVAAEPTPYQAFADAIASTPRLRMSNKALAKANDIDPARQDFVRRAAQALAELAAAPDGVGRLDTWFAQRRLEYASSGAATLAKVELLDRNGTKLSSTPVTTRHHLREGGRGVAPELAPRIYFKMGVQEKLLVVCYVGPHPIGDISDQIIVSTDGS